MHLPGGLNRQNVQIGYIVMRRALFVALPVLTLSSCVINSDESPEPAGGMATGGENTGGALGGTTGSAGSGMAGAGNDTGGVPGASPGGATNLPGGGASAMAGMAGADATGGTTAGGGTGGAMVEADAGDPGPCQEAGLMVGITAAHNAVRETVDPPNGTPLPPLSWSCEVADVAQAYADELAATMNCDLVHSGGDYGENLYWSSGFQPTPQDVVDAWASEEPCYSYDVFPDQCSVVPGQCDVCGHYTQMVWRNTEVVGCAMAECGQAQVWVCNYDPPGNYLTQYPY